MFSISLINYGISRQVAIDFKNGSIKTFNNFQFNTYNKWEHKFTNISFLRHGNFFIEAYDETKIYKSNCQINVSKTSNLKLMNYENHANVLKFNEYLSN